MRAKYFYLIMIISVCWSTLFALSPIGSKVDQICAVLEQELSLQMDEWKYSNQMFADAWKPNFSDKDWKNIIINEQVYPDSAWLRKQITIPSRILGTKVDGGTIRFLVTVDDAGICWINGEKKGLFKWNGEYVLTEDARPGDKFDIAIKAINTGGPMRLLRAELEWDKVKTLSKEVQSYVTSLKTGQKLLSDDTYLKTGRVKLDTGIDQSTIPKERRIELRSVLDDAVEIVDLKALKKGNLKQFNQTLTQSKNALKPVAAFAKEFTLIYDSNAHIDCAWLWRYLETINIAKNTFQSVLDMMDVRPEFTYTQSQAHLYWWMEKYFPDVLDGIRKRVNDGRWEIVGGMWVEPDCNLISGESWARQLLYGKRYFNEKLSTDVKIGWNPDSFGYNWNMPQFYLDAGIHSFITQKIGWNDTNMFPYRLFWWQSPDGRKLLTYFPNSYVNEIKNPFELVDWMRQFESNTGFRKMLVLYGVGDHGGGPDLEMIDRIEDLRKLTVYPKVEYGTASEYLNWIRKFDLSDIPVLKDELYLEYHRGTYTTQAKTKKQNRECEILLGNAEQLAALAACYDRPYKNFDFFESWQGVMFNQFHDILPGSSIYPVYKDSDEKYAESREIAEHEFETAFDYLNRKINTKVAKDAEPILIYNSLAWPRTDVVELEIEKEENVDYRILNETGEEIPSQVIPAGRHQNKILFIAENVPATGYTVYQIKRGTPKQFSTGLKSSPTELENEFLKITVDKENGQLSSVYLKQAEKEILNGPGNELQLFEDKPDAWDAWNIGLGEKYPLNFRGMELIESGPVRAVIQVKSDFLKPGVKKSYPTPNNPNSYFVQDIILYQGIDRIDFRTEADWWEEHVMLKVAFDVTAADSVACFEIPFGTIYRPTTMKNDWEKARFEVSQQKWSDLTDASKNFGVSLLNRTKYGGDIHDGVMRLSLLRSPKWPDPVADMGKHVIEYSLYPHQDNWKKAETMRKGYEYNYPLIAKRVESHSGKLPRTHSFVVVEPKNVILNSIKCAEPKVTFSPDRSDQTNRVLILRLFEFFGENTHASVQLPFTVRRAVRSNIMEEEFEELTVDKNVVEFEVPANRIMTIKLWL